MQPEPARCNGAFDAGAELVRRATGLAECGIDKLDVNPPSCTASTALAISTSLRAAASGLRSDGGTWIRLSSSQWLSNVFPQMHRIMLLGRCDGSRSPAPHRAYFRAVQSR